MPPILTIESPEASSWDTLKNPVPGHVLERIPLEIWDIILCHVPPTRLARLASVSKSWKHMINQLPLWKDIINQCNLVELNPDSGRSIMTYVLGHMVMICDFCLGSCDKFGAELPLPVRRPDIFGLIWMCKQCRDIYRTSHSDIMEQADRAPKDDDVYEQGASQKLIRQRPYYAQRYEYRGGYRRNYYSSDDSDGSEDEYDDESEDEYESDYGRYISYVTFQPTWKNKASTSSWLNEVLTKGRSRLLNSMLGVHGLKVRSDSRLCVDFINGTKYCPRKVVDVMCEMSWYFSHTTYGKHKTDTGPSSKAMAIAGWTQVVNRKYNTQSFDIYKNLEEAPPKSLWGKIESALKKHDQFRVEKAQWEQEKEAKRLLKLQSISENKDKSSEEIPIATTQDFNDHGISVDGSSNEVEKDSEYYEDKDEDDEDDEDEDNEDSEDSEDSDEYHKFSDVSIRRSISAYLMSEFSLEVDCSIKI